MAVVVADVVTMLQGVANAGGTGYVILEKYELLTTKITMEIEIVTRYINMELSASTRADYPDETDDLILHEVCYRLIISQIMGILMPHGFTFTALEYTVDTRNFPDIVVHMANSFAERRNWLLDKLKARITLIENPNMGVDAYNLNDFYPNTAAWQSSGSGD
jgi:hypothetical protein